VLRGHWIFAVKWEIQFFFSILLGTQPSQEKNVGCLENNWKLPWSPKLPLKLEEWLSAVRPLVP
jgi:hypothetical protein